MLRIWAFCLGAAFAVFAATGIAAAAVHSNPIVVKVVVVTMFEIGAERGLRRAACRRRGGLPGRFQGGRRDRGPMADVSRSHTLMRVMHPRSN